MKRQIQFVTVVLGSLSIASALGAIWWWALRGMSESVGSAWIFTTFLLGMMASIMAVIWSEID